MKPQRTHNSREVTQEQHYQCKATTQDPPAYPLGGLEHRAHRFNVVLSSRAIGRMTHERNKHHQQ